MEKEDIKDILAKIGTTELTAAEEAKARRWFLQLNQQQPSGLSEEQIRQASQAIWEKLEQAQPRPRIRRFWPVWAAAAVLIVATAATLIFFLVDTKQQTLTNRLASETIMPGGNRATLTLADGQTIDLSEAQTGIIVGDENITYADGSALAMSPLRSEAESRLGGKGGRRVNQDTEMLSLTTPKGGTYSITLPDGSKVWLNANSTLTYPSRFSGEERVVFLEGEAFFDISHQLSRAKEPNADSRKLTAGGLPFRVVSAGQTVQVLGTEFNIAAYPDDHEIKTTLVNGSVEIVNLQSKIVNRLQPGDQSTVREAQTDINNVDIAQYTAWTKGYFRLSADLETILKAVGRWYDVDVVFEDETLKTERASIIVLRDKPLSVVMSMLEEVTQARFAIQADGKDRSASKRERRLTVMR